MLCAFFPHFKVEMGSKLYFIFMNLIQNRRPDMVGAPSTVAHLSSLQAERIEALISLRGACVILVQRRH